MQGVKTYMPSYPQSLSSLMSGNGFSSMKHHYKKPLFNGWNESDELDVFEATQYFSGAVDVMGLAGGFGSHGVVTVEERVPRGVQNRNLDERLTSNSPSQMKEYKKCKQPSSPGARLVSYLNSIFHQAASRRKLKCLNPTSTTRDLQEEDEDAKEEEEEEVVVVVEKSLGERARRRSTRHSQSTKSSGGSKSSNFCGSSSFTTPDFYPNNSTPASYKRNSSQKAVTFCPTSEVWDSRTISEVLNNSGHEAKNYRLPGVRFEEKDVYGIWENKWVLNKPSDEYLKRDWLQDYELSLMSRGRKNSSRRGEEVQEDIGGESDSSSDLFELKIYDRGGLSDSLPVFATTDIEAIKRKTAISSTAS